ncbi:MAG: PKD domain-containing protein [Cytophagales bacterium]|nr:PKD domain-containing protein [Cytophagales bacterium]
MKIKITKSISLLFALFTAFVILFYACKKDKPEEPTPDTTPVADFTADTTIIIAGDTVNFTDLSTNTPTSWSWDFGDVGTSSLQNPSHTYTTAGAYTVSLTASNAYGSDLMIKNSYITVSNQTPTKTLMEGVWEVTEAYDSSGTDILDTLKVLKKIPPFFHLSSDGTVISTAGPMILYIVYNQTFLGKLSLITSTIDQIFNYFGLNFNGAEFFIATGVVDRFTLEMKLEGIAGTSTLKDILTIFGIQLEFLETVVYHKYKNVKVSFGSTNNVMVWEFDNQTIAEYNTKDQFGNYVIWKGWSINKFSKCKFVLTKKTKSIQDLVNDLK